MGILGAVLGLVHAMEALSDPSALGEADLAQLALDGLPAEKIKRDDVPPTFTQLLAQLGVAAGKQIKDALAREAILVNGQPVTGGPTVTCEEALAPQRALHGRFFLVRFGKKKYHLLFEDA